MDRASKVGDKCYTRHTRSLCQHSMTDVSFQRGDSRLFKVRCRGLTPNEEEMDGTAEGRNRRTKYKKCWTMPSPGL